jgi:signal recognition particle receptor subunit beta
LPLTGKGFQSQTIHLHGSGVALWDLDGKDHTDIQHWRHHYTGTDGFVFVLDSGDEDTLDHACVEFVSAMSDDQLSSASVLVLANKSDLPRTASVSEIQSKLGLIDASNIAGNRPFLVCAVSAITGQGVEKAFELLFRSMSGL